MPGDTIGCQTARVEEAGGGQAKYQVTAGTRRHPFREDHQPQSISLQPQHPDRSDWGMPRPIRSAPPPIYQSLTWRVSIRRFAFALWSRSVAAG
jgi:hypothetical protein